MGRTDAYLESSGTPGGSSDDDLIHGVLSDPLTSLTDYYIESETRSQSLFDESN